MDFTDSAAVCHQEISLQQHNSQRTGILYIMEGRRSSSQGSFITWSEKSAASKHTQKSSASSVVAMALAEAEGAKAKVKYAEKEMQMKMEKAHLDAEKACLDARLGTLDVEREAAIAVAKAEVLAGALMHDKETSCEHISECGIESHDPLSCTKQYVQEQAHLQASLLNLDDTWPQPPPEVSFEEEAWPQPPPPAFLENVCLPPLPVPHQHNPKTEEDSNQPIMLASSLICIFLSNAFHGHKGK